jgi:hypothetical protein
METERDEIDRKDTGFRILYSLLFWVIMGAVEMVVGALVVFELLFALVTKQEPPERVRVFANRAIAYYYRIGRYLTYNEPDPPFPFSEVPTEIEPSGSGS